MRLFVEPMEDLQALGTERVDTRNGTPCQSEVLRTSAALTSVGVGEKNQMSSLKQYASSYCCQRQAMGVDEVIECSKSAKPLTQTLHAENIERIGRSHQCRVMSNADDTNNQNKREGGNLHLFAEESNITHAQKLITNIAGKHSDKEADTDKKAD